MFRISSGLMALFSANFPPADTLPPSPPRVTSSLPAAKPTVWLARVFKSGLGTLAVCWWDRRSTEEEVWPDWGRPVVAGPEARAFLLLSSVVTWAAEVTAEEEVGDVGRAVSKDVIWRTVCAPSSCKMASTSERFSRMCFKASLARSRELWTCHVVMLLQRYEHLLLS